MPRPTARVLSILTVAVATASSLAVVAPFSSSAAESTPPTALDRRLGDSAISESSGLARSTYARDILWTHNDSGDSNRLFAVRPDGSTKAVIRLDGAGARDWEDVAAGPNHTLWIADIGDNARSRSSIQVYRVREPRSLSNGTRRATRFDLRYPDGAHDAEGLMVRPRSGRVFVVTKSGSGAVYSAPRELSASRTNRLTKVRSVPSGVTAAAFRPGGGFLLCNYNDVYVYPTLRGAPSRVFSKPELRQGESLELTRGGGAVLLGSEGTDSPVYRVSLG